MTKKKEGKIMGHEYRNNYSCKQCELWKTDAPDPNRVELSAGRLIGWLIDWAIELSLILYFNYRIGELIY